MAVEHIRHWRVGDVDIARIVEVYGFEDDISMLLPEATPQYVQQFGWLVPHFATPEGRMIISFQCFVLRSKGRTAMIDTCIGNDRQREFEVFCNMQNTFLEDLSSAGFPASQVTDVLCTHLHFDHVGWNTRLVDGKWLPTFPDARYLFARKEWDYWKGEHDAGREAGDGSIADSVIPIVEAKKAMLVEGDHAIDDQVWLEPTPGHTPGHICVHLKDSGHEAILTGDMMHHPVQFAEPQWSSGFCVDPKQSAATRRAFLDRNCETGKLVLAAHFATPTAGYIVPAGNTWRLK